MTGVAQESMTRDLAGLGLIETGQLVRFTSLPEGASSDIFKVEAGDPVFVIKRALPKLRVAEIGRLRRRATATRRTGS